MDSLLNLKGQSAVVSANDPSLEDGAVFLEFEDRTSLRSDYWRLIRDDKRLISSFDHKQKYGLPDPIDAITFLSRELDNQRITSATLDHRTGDLIFRFTHAVELQILNFTAYEIWEISFPNGAVEYSNSVPWNRSY
jgi:hypothetical protein